MGMAKNSSVVETWSAPMLERPPFHTYGTGSVPYLLERPVGDSVGWSCVGDRVASFFKHG